MFGSSNVATLPGTEAEIKYDLVLNPTTVDQEDATPPELLCLTLAM
jgi:hypothetical protein